MKKVLTCIILYLMIVSMVSCGKVENNASVGKVRLNIETYLAGQDQPTHPSVISFEEEWNGYKYWMAYTPYPEANGQEENPSIAASNDLYKWETPYGMVNPIADNEETGCDELKDGHILYRGDLNRIEVWYLGRVAKNIRGDGTSLTLFRKYSYDGVSWSPYEIMDEVQYLSPSIIWNNGKYQMWSIGFQTYDTAGTFVYQESVDGKNWTVPKKCSIGEQTKGLEVWHGTVSYDLQKEKYVFVYIPDSAVSQTIEACESEDGIHFTNHETIVENDKNTLWNHFYRPCLLSEEGKQHLFYGVITDENKWYISYSKGDSLDNLKGITEKDIPKMVALESGVTDTKDGIYICKRLYQSVRNYLRPETCVFIVVFFVLIFMITKYKRKLKFLQLSSIVLCMGYTFLRFRPNGFYAIFGAVGASIIEGICIYCVAVVVMQRILKHGKKLR